MTIQGTTLMDEMFIQNMEIPIPVCDSSFQLPGKYMYYRFAFFVFDLKEGL